MSEPTGRDRDIARAFVGLSGAVLDVGAAIAGEAALEAALNETDDDEGPATSGAEDTRPDAWVCPLGASDELCRLTHDHYPPPRRHPDAR